MSQVPFLATKLYVGNISYRMREEDLREMFAQAGEVTFARVIKDRETNRSKGFAFVEMASEEEAQKAIDMFHDQDIQGRKIIVNIARPKEEQ